MVIRSSAQALLCFVVSALFVAPLAASVELDINPDPAVLNESCRLTFHVTGDVDGEPDFTPLEAFFDIIGRNRQTAISWINGRSEETTSWTLSAMPRAAGRVTLPSIRFGSDKSLPRTLEIVASPSAPADDSADILLEVSATPDTPYVQQQVIYTLRLLHRVELSSPRFSALTTSSDAIVKPLGQGRQYVEKVNGTSYEAFEQRYAIFPQKSGRLTINPLVLTTQVVTGTRSFFDPFSQSLTTRRVESKAVTLDVRAVPASFPQGATWLPARRLRLHEEWDPDTNTTTAGAPLARTLFLWADGLIAGQLPELALQTAPGVKLYPDQAQSNEQDTATGFTAVQQQKFAIIATDNGDLRFPALEIPWWNTETDSLEIARLPERALSVTGGRPAAPPEATPAAPPAPTTAASPAADGTTADASTSASLRRWRAAALLALGGWAVTVLWWIRGVRRHRRLKEDRAAATGALARATARKRALHSLSQACGAHDAVAAREALLAWSRATAAARGATTLGAIAAACSGDTGQAIAELERHLYGPPGTPPWRGDQLAALTKVLATQADAADTEAPASTLPGLFRLAGR